MTESPTFPPGDDDAASVDAGAAASPSVAAGAGRNPSDAELRVQILPAVLETRTVYGRFDAYGVIEEFLSGREPRRRDRAWAVLGPALDDLEEQYGHEVVRPFLERLAEQLRTGAE